MLEMKNMKYKISSLLALLMFGLILSGCACKNNTNPSDSIPHSESIENSQSHEDNSIASDISQLESIIMSNVPTN